MFFDGLNVLISKIKKYQFEIFSIKKHFVPHY
jgi:hypothetical protein